MAKRKGTESLRLQDVTERMKALAASRPARREGTAPPRASRCAHAAGKAAAAARATAETSTAAPHRTQPVRPVERPVQKASVTEAN